MKKIILLLCAFLCIGLIFSGCSSNEESGKSIESLSWEQIVENGSNTTVSFYGWGGSQETNDWIDNVLTPKVKEAYNITLNRVPVDVDEMMNQLLADKQGNNEKGSMDIVWINGENFFTAMQSQTLYGPFTNQLPNMEKYLDPENVENNYDFGMAINGYEAPYGRAQFVMIGDEAKVGDMPNTVEKLKTYVAENKGVFTYPEATDFTGSAFIRTIIYNTCDKEKLEKMPTDEAGIREVIMPAMTYLKEIAPNLWREGKTYPTNLPQLGK